MQAYNLPYIPCLQFLLPAVPVIGSFHFFPLPSPVIAGGCRASSAWSGRSALFAFFPLPCDDGAGRACRRGCRKYCPQCRVGVVSGPGAAVRFLLSFGSDLAVLHDQDIVHHLAAAGYDDDLSILIYIEFDSRRLLVSIGRAGLFQEVVHAGRCRMSIWPPRSPCRPRSGVWRRPEACPSRRP